MKSLTSLRCFSVAAAWLGIGLVVEVASGADSGFELPTSSPRSESHQRIASTDVKVTYGRPSTRGREIFGELVPYGEIWRTGADSATQISFSTAIAVEGTRIEAGTYELFTIPGPQEWVVVLQTAESRWGSYAYDPANDVVRVIVKSQTLTRAVESFTIGFGELTASAATMFFEWQHTSVPVRLEVDVEETIVPLLEEMLRKGEKRPYFRGAMFYFENNLDLDRAAELMQLALEPNPTHVGMLYRLALIHERRGDIEQAIDAAQRSMASAESADGELKAEYKRLCETLLFRLRSNS